MTLRTILAPVRGDGKGVGVLNYAAALAKRFDAHIEVVHARPKPEDLLPFGSLVSSAMKKTILESAATSASEAEFQLRQMFEEYCHETAIQIVAHPPAPEGAISANWREETGSQPHVVALRGRLADVIVVAQPDTDSQLGENTLEAALLETGKLVMMVPSHDPTTLGDHVAIAWNGSAEAARAVTLGHDILADAGKVSILALASGGSDLSPEELVDHLAWHGIKAGIETFEGTAHDIGRPLLDKVNALGADLLVMGGYGHSRRRELVLGGVTRYVIDNTDMAVLMAH